jgi:hypothetical protein
MAQNANRLTRMAQNPWSKKEDAILTRFYPKYGSTGVLAVLEHVGFTRSRSSVRKRIDRLRQGGRSAGPRPVIASGHIKFAEDLIMSQAETSGGIVDMDALCETFQLKRPHVNLAAQALVTRGKLTKLMPSLYAIPIEGEEK